MFKSSFLTFVRCKKTTTNCKHNQWHEKKGDGKQKTCKEVLQWTWNWTKLVDKKHGRLNTNLYLEMQKGKKGLHGPKELLLPINQNKAFKMPIELLNLQVRWFDN